MTPPDRQSLATHAAEQHAHAVQDAVTSANARLDPARCPECQSQDIAPRLRGQPSHLTFNCRLDTVEGDWSCRTCSSEWVAIYRLADVRFVTRSLFR